MKEIVDMVKELQEAGGLTDTQQAAKLGIVRGSYLAIKAGRANIGLQFIRGVLRAYKDTKHARKLKELVINFLLSDYNQ